MKKTVFRQVSPNVDFPQLEKTLLVEWEKQEIVKDYLVKNSKSKKTFSFLDGPITANNPMGVHHAWGRTYKDLWQRFYNMRGFRQRFQNGFDCQGLWVEVEVEKELGLKNKKDIENLVPGDKRASIAKFVELCKARVVKFSQIQTEQSQRLGYFMDWDHSYYTMSDENNYMIWHFLKTCHEKGWIYKGADSVPWCPRCETAISQHEMLTEDYKEVVHKAIYFELPIVGREKEYLLVWTTTPWTIPANIAVAVDKNLEYSLVEGHSGDRFWLAKDLVEIVFGKDYRRIVRSARGSELVGFKYRGPFDDLPAVVAVARKNPETFHKIVATDPAILPITTSEGTGLVHTAVSAGTEDFRLGKKYKLPMIPVIGDNADYLPNLGFLTGKNAKKHPEIILDYLIAQDKKPGENWVFKIEDYKHRYPACWRCKTELVWRVTNEWYVAMDKKEIYKSTNGKSTNGKTLREQMVATAKMIDWRPKFGLERELDWLANMHDWLISKKNRYWGLALPIYECQKCGKFDVIGGKAELRERAVSGWGEFEGHSPHKPYIDEVKIKCDSCGQVMSRISDVGNVWLDAGIVSFSTLVDPATKKLSYTADKKYWEEWFPADFITESFPGQFKNWFYSLIAMSTVLEKRNPFKTVLGFATVLGEDGRPMHKSWGNAIEFNEGADKIGVDVMRWMFAKQNSEQNVLFGYKKADEARRKFHILLWNVYNFFVTYATVDRWAPEKVKSKTLTNVLDRWIMSKLSRLVELVTVSLERYDASSAALAIENFVTELSQWYVRRGRERVGPTALENSDKHACYQTLYKVLVTLSKILAPFTPFLAEEIYRSLTGEKSVHLADWPSSDSKYIDDQLENEISLARKLVEVGYSLRKENKIKTRQPLELAWHDEPKEKLTNVDVLHQVLQELNIKKWIHEDNFKKFVKSKGVVFKEIDGFTFYLDIRLTKDLIAEGEARELVRQIQQLRKEKQCRLEEYIRLQLPVEFKNLSSDLLQYIQRETLVGDLVWGDTLSISIG